MVKFILYKKNIEVVKNIKTPTFRKLIGSFLGYLIFYKRNFVELAKHSMHLINLTREKKLSGQRKMKKNSKI